MFLSSYIVGLSCKLRSCLPSPCDPLNRNCPKFSTFPDKYVFRSHGTIPVAVFRYGDQVYTTKLRTAVTLSVRWAKLTSNDCVKARRAHSQHRGWSRAPVTFGSYFLFSDLKYTNTEITLFL